MKPLEARSRLILIARQIAQGQAMAPSDRAWLSRALLRRCTEPTADLDRLLCLKSRAGGRLHLGSRIPERDQALRRYAAAIPGTVAERARELATRIKAHRKHPDPELSRIESFARLPGSIPQLDRILRGNTASYHLKA